MHVTSTPIKLKIGFRHTRYQSEQAKTPETNYVMILQHLTRLGCNTTQINSQESQQRKLHSSHCRLLNKCIQSHLTLNILYLIVIFLPRTKVKKGRDLELFCQVNDGGGSCHKKITEWVMLLQRLFS